MDVQVLSTNAYFYNYDKDSKVVTTMDVEANDHVAQLTNLIALACTILTGLPVSAICLCKMSFPSRHR